MKKKNKAFKIVYGVLKGIFTVFLVLVLLLVIIQRVTKNDLAIGGIRIFTIVSESMAPDYQIGDILISKVTKPEDLKLGDRVTYMGTKGDLKGLVVTHEIIEKREENGNYIFKTKGTANEFVDPEITEDNIYGKVVHKTVIFSGLSKMMNNIVIYYIFFVVVGVSVCYQLITTFRKEEKDDEKEDERLASTKESS